MPNQLNDLSDADYDRIDFVRKAASGKKIAIFKSSDTNPDMESENIAKDEPLGADGTGASAGAPASITKERVDEAIQKALEAERQKSAETVQKMLGENVELKKALEVERNVRVTKEYIEKAQAEVPHLPGTVPAKFGPILKEMAEKLPKETFDQVYTVLKAASAIVGQSTIFKEIGSSMDAPTGNSAEAQLDAIAKQKAAEIRKADTGLSYPEAYARAYLQAAEENPQLFKAHRAESVKGVN